MMLAELSSLPVTYHPKDTLSVKQSPETQLVFLSVSRLFLTQFSDNTEFLGPKRNSETFLRERF